uniref:Major facilitator superfamily (MFS) profile domain-containing protein n=1 Tax=Mola mola TaxID=94237 RepID=A0A3Q3WZA8_MOLML
MKDYDDKTAFLGQCGRFQLINFLLLCASIVPNGIVVFSIVFVADVPSHHCLVPDVNLTQEWRNSTIPNKLSSCSRYRLSVVRNLSAQGLVPGRDVNLTDLEQEGCVDGWSYSKDIYQSTIVTEFDLVCNEQWKQPFTSTVFFLGVLCGSFFSGQISDRFGRKPVLFSAIAIQSVIIVAQIFSPSWTIFCILFFITGIGRISSYVSAFVLGTEILSGKVRVLFSSLGVCVSFAIGYMLLPLFAYFLRDWKSLLFSIFLPTLLYVPLWWVIPESPRWLVTQGRVAEAEAIMRKAARLNKVEAPLVIFEDYTTLVSPEEAMGVLKNAYVSTIHLVRDMFTFSTGYYGLSLNTSRLHADPYISSFMSAAIEIPAYVFIWLALRCLRRKLCLLFTLSVAAVSLFFIQLVPQSLSYLAVALEMLGKFAVTAGASAIYVVTAELYPTVLRNTATGTCSILSRIGGSTAPFLFKLSIYFNYLPYIILGTLAVGSIIALFFLPETFGKPLPQVIQQMPKARRKEEKPV